MVVKDVVERRSLKAFRVVNASASRVVSFDADGEDDTWVREMPMLSNFRAAYGRGATVLPRPKWLWCEKRKALDETVQEIGGEDDGGGR